MPADFVELIQREHRDFITQLSQLLEPSGDLGELRIVLDALTLGLTAHAEAEHLALKSLSSYSGLETLIAQSDAEHLAQERALSALICAPLGSECGRKRAEALLDLIEHHAIKQERYLPAAICAYVPAEASAALAAAYATERLLQLSMLHPFEPTRAPAEDVRAPQ